MVHPYDTLRTLASRLLPIKWRFAMLRLFQHGSSQDSASVAASDLATSARGPGPDHAPAARPSVVCLPVIDWSFRKQRPQQLLQRLAQRGWPVLYVDLRFNTASGEATMESDELVPGVRGVHLPAARELAAGSQRLGHEDIRLMATAMARLRTRERIESAIVLCHSPFWFPLAWVLHQAFGWRLVYDRMDLHEGFETTYPEIGEDDRRLQEEADLVLASSTVLAEDSAKRARHVVYLGNGCDWPTWSAAEPSPELATLPRPIVGYFGAISSWFDSELVVSLALARPAWSFVLVGSTWDADTSHLQQLANVHMLGERPYAELPSLAATFDAAIIPRRKTALTQAMEPVKVYEMLALGVDIVAPPLAGLDAFEGLIREADGPESFLVVLDEVLRQSTPPEAVERRRNFARQSSWDQRVDQLEQELVGLYALVTIGIVTFNNRKLTELCLESLRQSTVYPNYQVVVVDNASSDGTREWLEAQAREWPQLTVIANETNRGFAAACNQAFDGAEGEILCFLNNDTVMTRGWLSAMVRHLQENPHVGMVGPVSNGVANSAKVEPGYSDLSNLDEWAGELVWRHRGESFSIPMLALYCAAMRRNVWEKVGKLDEQFGTGMFEDDDYSKRIRRAGYELRCLRDAYVHHWQQASFGELPAEGYSRLFEENRRRYRDKWRRRRSASSGSSWEDSRFAGQGDTEGVPVYDSSRSKGSMRDLVFEIIRYKDLLRLLVSTNIKTRYKRSALGVAWTLLNPLGTMIVMTIAFSTIFRFSLPNYPVYVLAGITFWTFFQQGTSQCMTSLVWGSGLLKKVYVPAVAFPLSAIGTGVVNVGVSLVPILLIMLALHQPFTWALLVLPLSVVLLAVFSLGIGLIMSSLAVFFTDVVDMYGVFLRIWFYLTPVMYPEKIIPERFLWMVRINPLYHFMACWRDPIYNGALPPLNSVLVASGWAMSALLVGWWVFSRQQHSFALRA